MSKTLLTDPSQFNELNAFRRKSDNGELKDAAGHIIAIIHRFTSDTVYTVKSNPHLIYLNLSDNEHLSKLVFEAPMPALRHFDVSDSKLQSLSFPSGFMNLEWLDAARNGLKEVLIEGDMPELLYLDLSGNGLTALHLPGTFLSLKYLYLGANKLTSFTATADFNQLEILHLDGGNKLTKLPEGKYEKLDTLRVNGNPLEGFSKTQLEGDGSKNATGIISELRARATTGTDINHRARLIIVGNGRVGKTCLVMRLKGLNCPQDLDYTPGILIDSLSKKELPDVRTNDLELSVWDFGGQEIFYATHQFLAEEAAYTYAWTSNDIITANRERDKKKAPQIKNEKLRGHDYWLDNIRMHGKSSPVLLVKTHALNAIGSFPFNDLKNKYQLEKDSLNFEAVTAEPAFLENLKKELTKVINELPILGTPISKGMNRLIADLRQERKNNNEGFLTKNEFVKKIITAKLQETDIDGYLDYLRKIGEVVYFPDNTKLNHKIFINPDKLTRLVYKLIDEQTEALLKSGGEFDEAFAKATLGWADWAEIVALLEAFGLIYKKESQGNTNYISPLHLPEKPVGSIELEEHKIEKGLLFRLNYLDFLPENVMINVLSEYGRYYSVDKVYRDAIYFIKKGTQEGCVIECNEEERIISVYAKCDNNQQLGAEVFDLFKSLSKKAKIHLCPKSSEQWIDTDILLDALNQGKDIPLVVSGRWLEDLDLLDFLNNQSKASYSHPPFDPPTEPTKNWDFSIGKKNAARILFFSANPDDMTQTQTTKEWKAVKEELERSRNRDLLSVLDPELEVELTDLQRALLKEPEIVHFVGHSNKEGIILKDEYGKSLPISEKVMKMLFEPLNGKTKLIVLNSCFSGFIAKYLSELGFIVIGSKVKIKNNEAISFAKGFYLGLAGGVCVSKAYHSGLTTLCGENKHDENIMELWFNGNKIK